MANHDADVTLNVGLNTKDVESQANQLRGKIENIFDKTNGKKMSSSFVRLKQNMRDLYQQSEQVSKKLAALDKQKFVPVDSKDYAETKANIDKIDAELSKLQAKLNEAQSIYGAGSNQYNAIASRIAYKQQLQTDAYFRKAQLEASGQAFTMESVQNTQRYQELLALQAQLNDRMQIATLRAGEFKNKITQAASSVMLLGKGIVGVIRSMGKLAVNIGRVVGKLRNANKDSGELKANLKSLLKFALKYGLGLRSIFILYKRLRSAGVEAYKGLASQFPELQREVNDLKNSFFQLKNSLATMAQPILSYLVPAIKTLMSWLTAAMNAIANFFAILTGAKYIYKATNANKDWAKSASGAGKAAKEANKDIAEYDNLILIQQDNDNGGGGGGGAADDYAGAFEKVKAESDLAQEIKDAINRGDWEGVGRALAKRLNNIQNIVDNWIQTKLRPKGKLWASRIARIFNGLIDEWDSAKFGQTIGHGLMAIADIISTWWETFDWKNLGKKIGTAITNLFTVWEPQTVARFLARKFNALGKFLLGLIDSKDGINFELVGQKIGETIKKTFTEIKWKDLAKGISGFLRGVMTSIRTAIKEADLGNSIATAINDFLEGFELTDFMSDLAKTANAIVGALADAIKNVNWDELGDAFAQLITDIDWTQVGKTIIITATKLLTIAQKIITAIGDAIEKVDWDEIGQAIADLLASIDWGQLIVTLVKVATGLIKGLGTALLKIASDPEALASLATGLLAIFGAKWIWNKVKVAIAGGIGSAFSGGVASAGLSGILNSALGKALVGVGTYEIAGKIGAKIAKSIFAGSDAVLAKEYDKFAEAPIQYTLNAVKETTKAAFEKSGLTGGDTSILGNALLDMFTGGKYLEQELESFHNKQQAIRDEEYKKYIAMLEKRYKAGKKINDADKQLLIDQGIIISNSRKQMEASAEHYATIAKKQAGVVSQTHKEMEASANHYATIAQQNAQKHVNSHAQMEQASTHHATIAKANAGVYEKAKQQEIASSNHYVQIAQANAKKIDTTNNDMASSTQHYVDIAKTGATDVSTASTTMATNVENSVTGIPGEFDKTFTGAYGAITGAFSATDTFFNGVASGVKKPFGTMADFFKTTFSNAWTGVTNVFQTNSPQFQAIQDSVSTTFKGAINSMINGINNSLLSPFQTLSNAFSKMKGFSINGASPFASLPSFSVPRIPRLAQGAVLPPNSPFLAVVGDQKQGTNIETPLDTMVDAFRQALAEYGGGNNQPIVLTINGRQVAQAVWDEENKRYKQTGVRYKTS